MPALFGKSRWLWENRINFRHTLRHADSIARAKDWSRRPAAHERNVPRFQEGTRAQTHAARAAPGRYAYATERLDPLVSPHVAPHAPDCIQKHMNPADLRQ